jgi:hypothetical protein
MTHGPASAASSRRQLYQHYCWVTWVTICLQVSRHIGDTWDATRLEMQEPSSAFLWKCLPLPCFSISLYDAKDTQPMLKTGALVFSSATTSISSKIWKKFIFKIICLHFRTVKRQPNARKVWNKDLEFSISQTLIPGLPLARWSLCIKVQEEQWS